jgi:hypothetical protein
VSFNAPIVGLQPDAYTSSVNSQTPGYSPVTIIVDGTILAKDFDPGQKHPDSRGTQSIAGYMPTDSWRFFAHNGKNTFSVALGNGARTHYWIHDITIRALSGTEVPPQSKEAGTLSPIRPIVSNTSPSIQRKPVFSSTTWMLLAVLFIGFPGVLLALLPTFSAFRCVHRLRYLILGTNLLPPTFPLAFILMFMPFAKNGSDAAASEWQRRMCVRFDASALQKRTVISRIAKVVGFGWLVLIVAAFFLVDHVFGMRGDELVGFAVMGLIVVPGLMVWGCVTRCNACFAWWGRIKLSGSVHRTWQKEEVVQKSEMQRTGRTDGDGKPIEEWKSYSVKVLAEYREVMVWQFCACCGDNDKELEVKRSELKELGRY